MKKRISRLVCAALVLTAAMGTFAACSNGVDDKTAVNEAKYNEACALIESGDYQAAYTAFKSLGDYKDVQKHLSRFVYFPSVMNYQLYDRSGVLTVTFGAYNLPCRMVSVGTIGTRDGMYLYDNQGKLIRQSMSYDGTFSAFDYTYDDNDNLVKAEYSEEGVVSAFNEYIYNEDGLLIREVYASDGKIDYDYDNTYDEKGNLIKSEFESAEGYYRYFYVYNDDGNLVNEHTTYPDGYICNIDYTYDNNGNLTQEVYSEEEVCYYTCYYTYDTAGNCIKEEYVYTDGEKDVITREYDGHGNITKELHENADGSRQMVETQYFFAYLAVDVPDSSMQLLMGVFDIL